MTKIDGGLRAMFRGNLREFDWCSIESGTTGRGIPDSNYCFLPRNTNGGGVEGWVEFKQTPGHTVPLRPEQVGWIARRVRNGGRVHIAVRQKADAGARRQAVDALWIIPGILAMEAKANGLKWCEGMPGVHVWYNGPSAWNWREIQAVLTSS